MWFVVESLIELVFDANAVDESLRQDRASKTVVIVFASFGARLIDLKSRVLVQSALFVLARFEEFFERVDFALTRLFNLVQLALEVVVILT